MDLPASTRFPYQPVAEVQDFRRFGYGVDVFPVFHFVASSLRLALRTANCGSGREPSCDWYCKVMLSLVFRVWRQELACCGPWDAGRPKSQGGMKL